MKDEDEAKILVGAAIAAFAFFFKEVAPDVWGWVKQLGAKVPGGIEALKNWWNGKTIAIIGATAAGKNSMFDRLQGKEPPKEHAQTRGTTKVQNFKIRRILPEVGSIDFTCSHAVNVGGEDDERERFWSVACSKADVIFYLVDAEKLHAEQKRRGEYLARVRKDFIWLDLEMSKFERPDVKIHILLNKIDRVDGTYNSKDAYKEHIIELFKSDSLEIERMAKAALGKKVVALTGVTPISMVDQTLFGALFDLAMIEIFKTSGSRDEEPVVAT